MTTKTMTKMWVEVAKATRGAKAIAWDGCHKIYLAMDDGAWYAYANGLPSGIVRDASGAYLGILPDFLAEVNDKHRWSFQRIARWIDQNL